MKRDMTMASLLVFFSIVIDLLAVTFPDDGLKALWKMDELDVPTTGNIKDELGYHHIQYNDGDISSGQFDGAYLYTGSNPYLRVVDGDNDITLGSSEFTLSMWVKFTSDTSTSPSAIQVLMHRYGNGPGFSQGNAGWVLYAVDHPEVSTVRRHLEMYTSTNNAWNFLGNYDFTKDQWYNIIVIRDEDDQLIAYVDGEALTSGVSLGNLNLYDSNLDLYIGYDPDGTWKHLRGLVDDVRIYSKARNGLQREYVMENVIDEDLFSTSTYFGNLEGGCLFTSGGARAPLEVIRTVPQTDPEHGQAVAVFRSSVNNEDISIKMETQDWNASSCLWLANTWHDDSCNITFGHSPTPPQDPNAVGELSIVFGESAQTIPSSNPHPRFTVGSDSVIVTQRANGVGIGTTSASNEPEYPLDVEGDIYISDIGSGLILRDSNGEKWRITITTSGTLVTSKL